MMTHAWDVTGKLVWDERYQTHHHEDSTMTIKERALELMQNAAENEAPVWGWDPILVADEIFAYSTEFSEDEYDYVIDAIMEIQAERGSR